MKKNKKKNSNQHHLLYQRTDRIKKMFIYITQQQEKAGFLQLTTGY